MRKIFFGTLAAALMVGAACTVHQTTSPALTGPSELATSVRITATPDSISQDGASQSSVVVSAIRFEREAALRARAPSGHAG